METEMVEIRADEEGNFDSPLLQSLYDVWERYDAEEAEENDVRKVLDETELFVQAQIQEMEQAAQNPDVDVHDPGRVTILTAFQAHLDAVEKMRSFFETDDAELIDEAFEQLQEATNSMMDGLHGILAQEDAGAPKLCIRCSAPNERTAGTCTNCNAVLPLEQTTVESRLISVEGPEGEGGQFDTTPSYIAVAEAHEAWSNAQLSDEHFFGVLAQVRENHVGEYEDLGTALETLSNEETDYDEAELRTRAEILEQNLHSMDQLIEALQVRDADRVEDAMFAFAQATIALVDAEKLSAESQAVES